MSYGYPVLLNELDVSLKRQLGCVVMRLTLPKIAFQVSNFYLQYYSQSIKTSQSIQFFRLMHRVLSDFVFIFLRSVIPFVSL